MMIEADKKNFFKLIDSLKKYRRAEIINNNGDKLTTKLYVDLLRDDYILDMCLRENTTFLIGRKGTGKSTIFLKVEDELKKKGKIFPCYIDVKTIYDASKPTNTFYEEVGNKYIPSYKRYIWEFNFIKAMINSIIEKLDEGFIKQNLFSKIIFDDKKKEIIKKLSSLREELLSGDAISRISLPQFEKYLTNIGTKRSDSQKENIGLSAVAGIEKLNFSSDITNTCDTSFTTEEQKSISNLILESFNIQELIDKIQSILKSVKFNSMFILLDDFSELDDISIKYFTDIIIAPLNNRSNEFIKFKIASYPTRTYFGAIDPTKIDQVELDFFKLYVSHNKSKMEELAIDFTKRILTKRSDVYLKKDISIFFDVSKIDMNEYYKLLFQTSFNVPRIMGYILNNCYESATIYNKPITIKVIKNGALKYYENTLYSFFSETTYSTSSMNEKISILQLKELLDEIVKKAKQLKTVIIKEKNAKNYDKNFPSSSHFHIFPSYENVIKTLELNYFINKVNEYKNRDSKDVSVYSINYGICEKNNILFGAPENIEYERKYFTNRIFNYSNLISNYLDNLKVIECNSCGKVYSKEQLHHLEFYHYKCNEENCSGTVETKSMSSRYSHLIQEIPDGLLLPREDIKILIELSHCVKAISAKELASIVDISSQSIGQRSIKLDGTHNLVSRVKRNNKYYYELTDDGKDYVNKILAS